MTAIVRTCDPIRVGAPAGRTPTRQIMIRSTQMNTLLHQDLARLHLDHRLEQAERQRLADYVVRVARARRHAVRARRRAERAQVRLRLLTS
jgi:hypothetical protein